MADTGWLTKPISAAGDFNQIQQYDRYWYHYVSGATPPLNYDIVQNLFPADWQGHEGGSVSYETGRVLLWRDQNVETFTTYGDQQRFHQKLFAGEQPVRYTNAGTGFASAPLPDRWDLFYDLSDEDQANAWYIDYDNGSELHRFYYTNPPDDWDSAAFEDWYNAVGPYEQASRLNQAVFEQDQFSLTFVSSLGGVTLHPIVKFGWCTSYTVQEFPFSSNMRIARAYATSTSQPHLDSVIHTNSSNVSDTDPHVYTAPYTVGSGLGPLLAFTVDPPLPLLPLPGGSNSHYEIQFYVDGMLSYTGTSFPYRITFAGTPPEEEIPEIGGITPRGTTQANLGPYRISYE